MPVILELVSRINCSGNDAPTLWSFSESNPPNACASVATGKDGGVRLKRVDWIVNKGVYLRVFEGI